MLLRSVYLLALSINAFAGDYNCSVLLTERVADTNRFELSTGDQVLLVFEAESVSATFIGKARPDLAHLLNHRPNQIYYWFETQSEAFLALTENEIQSLYSQADRKYIGREKVQTIKILPRQQGPTCLPNSIVNCMLNLDALGALPAQFDIHLNDSYETAYLLGSLIQEMESGDQITKANGLLKSLGVEIRELRSMQYLADTLKQQPVIITTDDVAAITVPIAKIPSYGTRLVYPSKNPFINEGVGHAILAVGLLKNDRVLVVDPSSGMFRSISLNRLISKESSHDVSGFVLKVTQPHEKRTTTWKERIRQIFR